jgi:lipopolysaccharide transport system permease protein
MSTTPLEPPVSPLVPHPEHPLPDEPLIVIEPARRWALLNLREILEHFEILPHLAWRDIAVRYKQSVLGVLWAILQPLLTTLILILFFGKLPNLQVHTGGVPYPLFAYAGLLLWTFFSNAVITSGNSLVVSANLISKVYFPRAIIPAAAIAAALFDFFVASFVLVGMLFFYRIAPTPRLLLAPFMLLMMVVLALGTGMWMAALNVRYRDIRHAMPFLVQLLLFVSAVIYPSTMITGNARRLLLLNPIAVFVEGFRAALFGLPLNWTAVGIACAVSFALLAIAAFSFQRLESTFADVV